MACPHKEIASLRWTDGSWQVAKDADGVHANKHSPDFRLATMNILTDTCPWPIRLAIASQARFERLIIEISRLDATVLGLNEVSRTSLQMLLDSDFVRTNYYVTELPSNKNTTLNGPHGCVLLSKLPFEQCYALEPIRDVNKPSESTTELAVRKPVVGVVQVAGRRVAVCSMHTVAYQTPHNMAIRAQQIRRATSFVQSLDVHASFVLGDLNMHYIAEDGVIPENGLLDCWAETHFGADGDMHPGFTFDAIDNSMIPRYIPGEVRRMRLDRILCCEGGAFAPVRPVAMWGDKAVDAKRDLYLSDHYGLVVDLQRAQGSGYCGKPEVCQLLKTNSKKELEAHPVSWPRFSFALIRHVVWLLLRLIGLA